VGGEHITEPQVLLPLSGLARRFYLLSDNLSGGEKGDRSPFSNACRVEKPYSTQVRM
jgi:hypothetical protein